MLSAYTRTFLFSATASSTNCTTFFTFEDIAPSILINLVFLLSVPSLTLSPFQHGIIGVFFFSSSLSSLSSLSSSFFLPFVKYFLNFVLSKSLSESLSLVDLINGGSSKGFSLLYFATCTLCNIFKRSLMSFSSRSLMSSSVRPSISSSVGSSPSKPSISSFNGNMTIHLSRVK